MLVFLLCCTAVLVSKGLSSYTRTGPCQDSNICVYNYIVSANIHDKRGKEKSEIEATVHLKCDSVGTFQEQTVTYYCIDVKNVSATLTEITSDNEDKIRQRDMGGDTETQKKNEKAYENSLMSQRFCFVRNEIGKVLSVFHPPDERSDVVNFKKTLVSAFQANFAETEEEEETDSQSQHTSHYSYTQAGDRKIQHRTVDKTDVKKYAGLVSKKAVDFHTEEDIEVDQQHTIYRTHGEGKVGLSSSRDDEEEDEDFTDEGSGSTDEDIPPMETNTTYTLELRECIAILGTEDADKNGGSGSRSSRSAERRWARTAVMDVLMAKWDQRKHDQFEMTEINKNLPNLQDTARRVSRSTDGDIKKKARDLWPWKRLLWLESKHGPVPGTKPKVFLLTKLLDQVKDDTSDHSYQLRLMLYSLLSFEGSLMAQKSLSRALETCNDDTESNAIIMALTMLSGVHSQTVTHLQQHIKEDNDRYAQLLLSFATFGRHKNVEDQVLNILVDELAKKMNNISGANDSSEIIHLIHALGNTGSRKVISYILPFLLSSDTDIQHVAIDALRTVTRDNGVQGIFEIIAKKTASLKALMKIVESLIFPFEQSIYFPEPPNNAGESEQEQSLMRSIVKATADFNSTELTKLTKVYLKYVKTSLAQELLKELDDQSINRVRKRSLTTNWSNSYSLYNLISSHSQRLGDKQNYPYNKAILWAKQLGPSKVHAQLAIGGFSGIGIYGYKLFAKGVAKLRAYSFTYTAVEAEYLNRNHLLLGQKIRKYAKIIGVTYINEHSHGGIPYQFSWNRNLYSLTLFYKTFSVWIWIGTLDFYLGAYINVDISLKISANLQKATGEINLTPSFSVTGGASVTVLVFWKVGLEVSASIDYYLSPQADVTLCDIMSNVNGKACFVIYHGSNGVDVDIYAYYRSLKCSWSWWKISCNWGGMNKLSLFSNNYAISALSKKALVPHSCATFTC